MATINLNLSKKENVETSACELLIRLSLKRGVVYRVKSGIYVPAKSWNVAKSKVIIPRMHTRERAQLAKIQSVIDELTNLLIERCVDTPIETIDKKWVEQIIHVFHFGEDSNKEEGEETLVEAFDQFIKERAKKDDRKRQFLCLKRMLLRYELYCGKHYVLELGSLTVDRLCKFEDFLRIEHTFCRY